jgi:DNA-3-methyladenine glycosylase
VSGTATRRTEGTPLGTDFFARSVHEVARELVGCTLLYEDSGGVIVETESYAADDPACHAYNGPTPRSEVLFGPPGRAYVYLSYGIHKLLNAVAEADGEPGAVLIRALEPTVGIAEMIRRRGHGEVRQLCSGPGKLTQALGIGLHANGSSLSEPPFRIIARSDDRPAVVETTRIGITKAAERPWRFCASESEFVSVRPRAA